MENKPKSFKELAETARRTTAYLVQNAILDFTEDVVGRMESLNITKSELASKLHTSPAYVTKLLRGDNNFTLETMVKITSVVNAELRIHLQPQGALSQWIDVLEAPVKVSTCVDEADIRSTELYNNRIAGLKRVENEAFALAA